MNLFFREFALTFSALFPVVNAPRSSFWGLSAACLQSSTPNWHGKWPQPRSYCAQLSVPVVNENVLEFGDPS